MHMHVLLRIWDNNNHYGRMHKFYHLLHVLQVKIIFACTFTLYNIMTYKMENKNKKKCCIKKMQIKEEYEQQQQT